MKHTDKKRNPGGPAEDRFTETAIISMREEILLCSGNEVFFTGRTDEAGRVAEVEPLARGNEEAVPALMGASSFGDVVIHNHPTGFLVPSEADLSIASRLGSDGIGSYIVDNDIRRVNAVVEPAKKDEEYDPLDPDEISDLLGPDGPLAKVHPQYEVRPSQCSMASEVTRILESESVGVFEAGTGTGKSLAYLIPSVRWALSGNRRVVVSTNTINLQEQHLIKDLPLVEEVLGESFSAVLVKGRGNYLCLRKRDLVDTETGEILLDFDNMQEMRSLLDWSRTTPEGSLSDLSFVPAESNWSLIKSESDSCLRARCAHFSTCFFFRMRREAASAQILLANHHILFADLSFRSAGQESSSIMPRYDAVILDEAHNVEDVALSYFDSSFGRWGTTTAIGRLVSRRRSERGLIPFLQKKIQNSRSLSKNRKNELNKLTSTVFESIQGQRVRLESAFDELAEQFIQWLSKGKDARENRWRITPEKRIDKQWHAADKLLGEMSGLIRGILTPAKKLNRELRNLMEDGNEELAGQWSDIGAVVLRLQTCVDFINRVREGEAEDEVFWAQVRMKGRRSVNLHLTPLDAASILENTLFSSVGPVVMTSATLTVGGSFDFMRHRLGIDRLDRDRIMEMVFPSPFDFNSQMKIAFLDDIPDPGKMGYVAGLREAVREMITASDGNSLVLFTSYRTLDEVFEGCCEDLSDIRRIMLRQGEAPRTALLERFRQDPGSVLFATDSFWEGVDVVGDSLTNVIIARLPFPVPTDPVTEARGEALQKAGRDPFMEDSVPRAVIRLRQGVGRLIRHRDDTGFAIICDARILRRFYGRLFIDSLPPGEQITGSTGEIAAKMKEFFAK